MNVIVNECTEQDIKNSVNSQQTFRVNRILTVLADSIGDINHRSAPYCALWGALCLLKLQLFADTVCNKD
jgi:hypothetical protein